MLSMVKRLISEEEGQGMTEYALVLGVIAVGAIVTITAFRTQVAALWTSITTSISAAIGA
jgi:pilus assembly protein Flp/PilA